MKLLVNISRIIVGVLFIFSGLIKANDPLGLSYKMGEFFDVWNFHLFDSFTLWLAVLMIVFEIIAGFAILLGWQMKLFSWLLLLLIVFFTFLTGYAYLSGKIHECGCFGNCIPLTSGQSFSKDILLLILILFLFINQRRIKSFLSPLINVAILFLVTVFSFSFQWFTLQQLPVVDCLPYKIGNNILEKMKPPPGSVPDSTAISFTYEKNGKQIEFTADKFPADFDSTYKFIKRYDKLIRQGNAEAEIKDFKLFTESGIDTTFEVLSQKGYKIFLFAIEMPETDPAWNKEFSVVLSIADQKNIPVYLISANGQEAKAYLQKNELAGKITMYTCDATAIKTAARANPVMYLLKQSIVLNKWSYADFENSLPDINALPQQNPVP
jgi:uncharacterized membrane protein YphA (DoxX/SURF4 family)